MSHDPTANSKRDFTYEINLEKAIDDFTIDDGSIRFYSFVQALILKTKARKVIDFGAGRGAFWYQDTSVYRRYLKNLRVHGPLVIACDVDDIVKDHPCSDEQMVLQEGEPLPFDDASVDIVVSDMTFEHIEDAKGVSKELLRIVKPGGWICARTPNRFGYPALVSRLVPNRLHATLLRQIQPRRKEQDIFDTYYRMNDPKQLSMLFSGCDTYYYRDSADPAYFFGRRSLYQAVQLLHRLLPAKFATTLQVFICKPEGSAVSYVSDD